MEISAWKIKAQPKKGKKERNLQETGMAGGGQEGQKCFKLKINLKLKYIKLSIKK